MNTTDIVILVILGLAVIKGLKDGIIKQVGGIAGLLLGIYLACKFSTLLSEWIGGWMNASEQVVKIISFAVIIIIVIICMSLIGKLLEKVFDLTSLGWINKVLGIVFSLFAAVLIIGVLLSLVNYINDAWFVIVPKEQLSESKLLDPIVTIADKIFPYLKEFFKNSPIPLP